MRMSRFLRRGAAAVLAASGLALAGCHDALQVTNPAVIPESGLQNTQLITVLVNSAVNQVQNELNGSNNPSGGGLIFYSGILTDEALNGTNDYRSGELSQRIVELAQGDVGPYQGLAQMRAVTDSIATRLMTL